MADGRLTVKVVVMSCRVNQDSSEDGRPLQNLRYVVYFNSNGDRYTLYVVYGFHVHCSFRFENSKLNLPE